MILKHFFKHLKLPFCVKDAYWIPIVTSNKIILRITYYEAIRGRMEAVS
jgi:hypothetical protein